MDKKRIVTHLAVSLTPDTQAGLDKLSAGTGFSRDELGARAIEDFVATATWQFDKIEKGLAAANKDEFASDEAVAQVRTRFT